MEKNSKNEEDSGLITVAVSYGISDTLITLSYLEAYGVFAYATPFHTAIMNSYMMIGLGGIQINVPAQQRSYALELLSWVDENKESETDHKINDIYALTGFEKLLAVVLFLISSIPWPDRGRVLIK